MMHIPKIPPGNIWSGDKLRAVFTNPTEIAFRKGNLKKHWPIEFRGRKFEDAESAYQTFKAKAGDKYELCTAVLVAKLRKYPILAETIRGNGGLDWLKQCSHLVNGRNPNWEGHGIESEFIRCLMWAYEEVTSPEVTLEDLF